MVSWHLKRPSPIAEKLHVTHANAKRDCEISRVTFTLADCPLAFVGLHVPCRGVSIFLRPAGSPRGCGYLLEHCIEHCT